MLDPLQYLLPPFLSNSPNFCLKIQVVSKKLLLSPAPGVEYVI